MHDVTSRVCRRMFLWCGAFLHLELRRWPRRGGGRRGASDLLLHLAREATVWTSAERLRWRCARVARRDGWGQVGAGGRCTGHARDAANGERNRCPMLVPAMWPIATAASRMLCARRAPHGPACQPRLYRIRGRPVPSSPESGGHGGGVIADQYCEASVVGR